MIKRKYICKKCRREFVMELYEEGEAEEKKVSTSPVRCPYCGSSAIERK